MLNDVELEMVELECSLLDTLVPEQFEQVQALVRAARLLTTARCALAELERREADEAATAATPRSATCFARTGHRSRRRERLVRMSATSPSPARRG